MNFVTCSVSVFRRDVWFNTFVLQGLKSKQLYIEIKSATMMKILHVLFFLDFENRRTK